MPMSKDYTKYDVLDFVDDVTFAEFVQNTNKESVVFWNKWIKEHPEADRKVEQAAAFIQAIQIEEPDIPTSKTDVLFNRISDSIERQESEAHQARRILPIWRYAAAAVILLFIGIWTFWPKTNYYETEYAMTKSVDLPDESIVNLNAGSTLSFNSKSWDQNREVALSGEAFFDVEKGSSFVVNTDLGQVEVLGTSFNVLNRGTYFEVQCITGRVKVHIKDQELSQEIVPNEAVYYDQRNGSFEKRSAPTGDGLWTKGVANFMDKPLDFVFEELERQYNIEINSEQISGTFNGPLTLKDLDEALYDLCWPMKLNYEVKDDQVTISK